MRYRPIIVGATITLILVVILAGCSGGAKKPSAGAKNVVAQYVKGGIGEPKPGDKVWQKAPAAAIPLLSQDLTDPKLTELGVSSIRVRALCDDKDIAFEIEWDDPTQDNADVEGKFSDAVAIQLPPMPGGETPDPTMGQTGKPVHIHLWKASYQRSLELGDWSLQQNFPNASIDHYPCDGPKEQADKEKLTEQFTIGLAAGNAIAQKRTSSVDDLMAEGFGSLTSLPAQASKGWSRWENGRWSVVIISPLSMAEWPG
ncbi:MAG: hypothetical protein HY801_12920, partial [Candidatus Lindowbacteria bacterium]|nr:hypothetical protein [Candidatus Lindowbacteria bacterium]